METDTYHVSVEKLQTGGVFILRKGHINKRSDKFLACK